MIKNIFSVLLMTVFLVILYLFVDKEIGLYVWAYYLMAAGLYFGRWLREFTFLSCIIALYLVIKYASFYQTQSIISCIIFVSIVPIPYFYLHKKQKVEKDLSNKNIKLKEQYTDILVDYTNSAEERQKYEKSIERIMQLYIIGRDLTKSVFTEDYSETVMRILTQRAGVVSVNVFEKGTSGWTPLAFSKPYQKNDWIIYMQFNKEIDNLNDYAVVKNPVFCSRDNNTVFWPLKIDEELLGCIIIVCEKEFSQRYIEEGAIFGPQISLGAKRVSLFQEIRERSRNDGLTGLYLKRYFMERLQAEIQREKRYSGGFYILMLDIDYFKQVNDKHGHLAGDKVLCAIAKIIVDCVRPGDLVGRYGGEEFIVFMPMASVEEAKSVAGEINKTVAKKKFSENGEPFNVTISIGLSNFPEDASTLDHIVNAADKALYKAKQSGRNRVIIYNKTANK